MTVFRKSIVACKYMQFTQDVGASHHPFVVVSTRGGKLKILVCTDANHRSQFSNCVDIDYQACGLSKPTVVICSKYAYLTESDVTSHIGTLSSSDYRRIMEEFYSEDNEPVQSESVEALLDSVRR